MAVLASASKALLPGEEESSGAAAKITGTYVFLIQLRPLGVASCLHLEHWQTTTPHGDTLPPLLWLGKANFHEV